MAIGKETALAILQEAKSAGYEDQPIPAKEEDLIARAEYFYEKAKEAFEDNSIPNDNTIQSIIFLGDSPLPSERGIEDTYPRRSSGGLSEGDERETDNLPNNLPPMGQIEFEPTAVFEKENLPVPAHIEADPDPMPRDLSSLSDREVRRLSGEYNAYLARVTYLLGVESSDLANSEHLLDAEKARALRELDLTDPNSDSKKQKLAKVIDAEILADEKVVEYASAVSNHQQTVIVLKSLKEIYGGNVERLSREWTMRQNEWEKSK